MSLTGDLGDPSAHAFAVTPSDTVNLPTAAQALYIGSAGDVVIHTLDGSQVTFVGLSDGQILPVRTRRVLATGTTAASIVALV
jgi:hypothetical protein